MQQDKDIYSHLFYIKLGILLFFTCWFLIASLSNLADLLAAIHWIKPWKFRSGNYIAVQAVLSIYHTPNTFLTIIFSGIIFMEITSMILFALSFIRFLSGYKAWPTIHLAFGVSMALWGLFLCMEEVFIAYQFESVHLRWLTFESISLLLMHVLPDSRNPKLT